MRIKDIYHGKNTPVDRFYSPNSKVSTTTDYYSHMLKDADDISAETIADVMLRHKNPNSPDKAG